MRKKLWFALLAVAILGVAAGAHIVSGLNAQDAPKKDADAKKDDWFENLKKALEAKKEVAPPQVKPDLPALPPMSVGSDSGVKPAPVVPPPLPPMKDDKPVFPTAPDFGSLTTPPKKDDKPATIPPPNAPDQLQRPIKDSGISFQGAPPLPPAKDGKPTIPPPSTGSLPPLPKSPANEGAKKPGDVPGSSAPATTTVQPELDAIPPIAPQVKDPPLPIDRPVAPQPKDAPRLDLPPTQAPPPTVQIAPNPIGDQVAKMKDCPWSLHVEIVDGKTVMTCTVHKKHEFKIVCQHVDLQTGKTMLKATGKVQITGDMMTGMCENLSIPLMDDRLVMEGAASVSIQKTVATVSNDNVATFELKGSSLDLRISEIVHAKPIQQASFQPDRERVQPVQASNTKPAVKDAAWTPYGRLMPAKISLANEVAWSLVGADGNVIAYVVARDGGTLSQYEGQRIMVRGTNEQISGRMFLRVTHIALP